ncbi:hypothetical protein GCK72_021054 [Caenorhabditis remanei]|uniref:F-box domain-containing protein n=1 Tax=Caenorhabditis remanei TaxID=31234 RepID=A0A6A5GIR1_CAERE|nr:hypothetical protein GCK72_021054 [Caenorhabditis remanei]KAF1754491.1 hypothetical protein GCK72_021054 [Caenorhabditis remanei]
MSEVIDTDSLATRRRILEEFEKVQEQIATNPELWRKLSFKAHEKLCKVLGADFIDYPEFEFWFSRFVRGDLELDYDRRLQLRDVCKDIRAHVDNWDPKVTEISYSRVNAFDLYLKSRPEPFCSRGTGFYRDPNSFVMNVLKHPKLRLEKLTVYRTDNCWMKLIKQLEESNRKLHVKKIEFARHYTPSKIDLHFMIPGVLEEIKMFLRDPYSDQLYEIIKSEQCQSAKMVHIASTTSTSRFPLDALFNCSRFTLRLSKPADGLKAAFLKKLMKKSKVQECVLYADSQIMKYFNETEAMVPNFPSLRRYPIPGTNDFYELEYQGDVLQTFKMSEAIDTDSLAIRRRILEEFEKVQTQIATNPESWRKLSFKAHEKLCKVLGADFIDYPEFEFWFSRFLRGNLELDYDRSSDPKTRSFTDLPLEIFENVGEYLELHERLQLRDVCKDIRAHVDNWDPKVTKISYSRVNSFDLYLKSRPEPFCSRGTGFYRDPNSFVMSVLKHPKLRLEKLEIYAKDDNWKEFIKELDESNRKLHVKKIEFPSCFSSKIDLHFLIPGVLEEIEVSPWNPTREDLCKMIESEQCQSAKMVHIRSWTDASEFPFDVLYKCPRFTLHLHGNSADGLISEFLERLMKYGEVQKCVLCISKSRAPPSQIFKYFNEPEAMVPNFPSRRRYPIPETNDFYELEYREKVEYREESYIGYREEVEYREEILETHKMAEITERDPLVIRGRILKEFGKVQTEIATNPNAWRSVASRAHKRISEAMGYDYVDYPEFEFWFLRFLQGNFDWGYDRTSDPKPHSLTDLPSDVFNKISGNLNLDDRLQLRDVCNDFRAHVDNWDLKVDEIYYRNGNDWRVWETYGSGFLDSFEQNENKFCPDFYRYPISFVMNVLKHPKLQLEKLTIRREDKYWKTLIKRLDETNRQLHVKNVEFAPYYRPSEIDLHFMIPEVIEEIKLYLVNPKRKEVIEIVESEQCQKAKMGYIESPTVTSQFPLQAHWVTAMNLAKVRSVDTRAATPRTE